MKITILIDNNTLRDDLVTEKGFSAFIEVGGKNVLYDTGKKSGNLVANAGKLDIDLLKTDVIAMSHGHQDHANGLKNLIKFFNDNNDSKKRELIIHPKGFVDRWNTKEGRYIGTELKEDDLAKHFDIRYSTEPVSIADDLIWLGEIEKTNDFEGKDLETHTDEGADAIEDDTALIYKSKEGLVVMAGCGHSGICNIIEYAKKVGGEKRIADVIGGIHLKRSSLEMIEKTVTEVEKSNPQALHFCHCTGENAYSYLKGQGSLNFSPIGCGWIQQYK